MKIVRVILSEEAEEAYRYLNENAESSKVDRSILNTIKKKLEMIVLAPRSTSTFRNERIT